MTRATPYVGPKPLLRTHEILEMLTTEDHNYKLAHFLASLEARVNELESKLTIPQTGLKKPTPNEPASWEERFEKEFVPNGIDSEDDDTIEARVGKFKAFIAEEITQAYERGVSDTKKEYGV